MSRTLPSDFFCSDTVGVARSLLGCRLFRREQDDTLTGGVIVETEAYLGPNDPAAHSRNGLRSARNGSMYLSAGHLYVYFTYGMHHCVNIVTASEDEPEAVLIRALQPTHGLETMRGRRPRARSDFELTNGPGKLCQALDIDLRLDGAHLDQSPIDLLPPKQRVDPSAIEVTGRIGIDRSGVADWPLRFTVRDSPWLSRKSR